MTNKDKKIAWYILNEIAEKCDKILNLAIGKNGLFMIFWAASNCESVV